MKYLGGSFSVGGYSREGGENYDRIFGKGKPEKPSSAQRLCCGLEMRWSAAKGGYLCIDCGRVLSLRKEEGKP